MGRPIILLRDPEAIKKIAIKDFDYFTDHRNNIESGPDNLFGNSLISLTGDKWREMRSTLSPAFTGSKIRLMFEMISECGDNLVKYFQQETRTNGRQVLEMKDIFSRFANDIIATTAFGIKVDSMQEKDNIFYKMGTKMMNFANSPLTAVKVAGYTLFPRLLKAMNITIFDQTSSNYFKNIIFETMNHREEKGLIRHDMINLLMDVRKNHSLPTEEDKESNTLLKTTKKREWTDTEIASQCFLFFVAGFDTVSTVLSFLAYELTVQPDIQEKLYEEIAEAKEQLGSNPLSYDVIIKMKYLDMVISETLRKWPPAAIADRVCVQDYVFDDEQGIKFPIEKGMNLWIPTFAIHRDPQYYPEPEKFDPERFSEENKHNINPSAYLPFGIGPRNCIGMRFALIEVKTVLYHLLLNFSFEATEKTQIPLKLSKSMIAMNSEKGIWLELKPRPSAQN